MANVVIPGEGLNDHDRRYGLRRPSAEECEEMGWHMVRACTRSERLEQYDEMRKWCEDNVHWSEFRWDHFRVYFKNKQDHLMFVLKWA